MTGRGPRKQSRNEFYAGSAFCYAFIFSLFVQGIAVKQLLSEALVDEHTPLSLPRKVYRILCLMALRGAWLHIALGVGLNVLMYLVISRSRLVIYVSSVWMVHILGAINAISYDLFKTQTKRGRKSTVSVVTVQTPRAVQTPPADIMLSAEQFPRQSFCKSLGRAWRRYLPLLFTSTLAVGYVHVTSVVMLDSSNTASSASRPSSTTALFVFGSVVLKFSLQEVTKRILLMRSGLPKREEAMILIATPTLLVDIQLRIVLLQLSNMTTTSAAKGSLGLGIIEVFVRFLKMMLVRWEAQGHSCWMKGSKTAPLPSIRQSSLSSKPLTSPQSSPTIHKIPATEVGSYKTTPSRTSSEVTRRQTTRVLRILVIHACETYADMYAEYLALGCSYAVLVVFSRNPHFNLYYTSGAASSTSYWSLFGLQIAIEVAVDSVSSAIEVALGLQVESIAQHTWTAAGHMVLITFVNVGLCAGLYQNG